MNLFPKVEVNDPEFNTQVMRSVIAFIDWQGTSAMRDKVAPFLGDGKIRGMDELVVDKEARLGASGFLRCRDLSETVMRQDPHAYGAYEVETNIPGAEVIRMHGVRGVFNHTLPSYESGELEEYLSRICSAEDGSMIVAIPAADYQGGEDEIPPFVLFRATPGSVEQLTDGTPVSHADLECFFQGEAISL